MPEMTPTDVRPEAVRYAGQPARWTARGSSTTLRPVSWRTVVVGAALLALAIKLSIAGTTLGSGDVRNWLRFEHEVTTLGGLQTYRVDDRMNHPPLMVLVLRGIHVLDRHTPLPFPFWIRLPAILSDVAMLLIVAWRFPPSTGRRGAALVLLALAPPLILISGFHGNTDPVMITFAVLAAVLLDKDAHPALAGIAFGMSLNVKIVPIILVPALLLAIPTWRGRLRFGAAAALTVGLPSLPYLVAEPRLLLLRIVGYGSNFGDWGYTRVLRLLEPRPWAVDAAGLARRWGRVPLFVGLASVSLWQARYAPRTSAFWRCGTVFGVFFALTPGFGVQYLAWMVPWVVALGPAAALAVYATSGLFLLEVYAAWVKASPGNYAAYGMLGWTPYPQIVLLEQIAWLTICATLILFLTRRPSATSQTAPRHTADGV